MLGCLFICTWNVPVCAKKLKIITRRSNRRKLPWANYKKLWFKVAVRTRAIWAKVVVLNFLLVRPTTFPQDQVVTFRLRLTIHWCFMPKEQLKRNSSCWRQLKEWVKCNRETSYFLLWFKDLTQAGPNLVAFWSWILSPLDPLRLLVSFSTKWNTPVLLYCIKMSQLSRYP